MRRFQNPSHPPSIYPALPEYTPALYKVTLPESTPFVQNLPPPPPLVYNYMRHFQNLPLPPSLPEFTSLQTTCDPPRIHPLSQNIPPFKYLFVTLPESTPPSPFFDNYMRHSHKPPLPPRIYPLSYKMAVPESTPSVTEWAYPLFYNYM